ncbi:MAG: head GIN domain-containing protein [Ramlibacter sp.]|nr:head GIN domain-containing protein [Ramlibacter sp.]
MNPKSQPRRLVIIWAALAALAFGSGAAWARGDTVKGNGAMTQETRALGNFKGIALGVPAQVEVRMGNVESVTIDTDANILPLVETVVEKGTLHIRPARRNLSLQPRTLKVVVQARQIGHLAIGGGGSIKAAALKAPKLDLDIGGAGSIDVSGLESEAVATAVGGSGDVKLGGTTRKLTVSIGGSGDVKAGQLKAEDVNVNIGGSGDVTVWAAKSLSAAIAGSGDIDYWGDPQVTTAIVGAGHTRRLGPAPR